MAKKSRDEEEVIVALVVGLLLATVAIFMFAMRIGSTKNGNVGGSKSLRPMQARVGERGI